MSGSPTASESAVEGGEGGGEAGGEAGGEGSGEGGGEGGGDHGSGGDEGQPMLVVQESRALAENEWEATIKEQKDDSKPTLSEVSEESQPLPVAASRRS